MSTLAAHLALEGDVAAMTPTIEMLCEAIRSLKVLEVNYFPGMRLIPAGEQNRAFDWLLVRINTNMTKAGSQAIIFCDEGKSYDSIRRKLGIHNFIPSRIGDWGDGKASKNFPTDRILEDIVYRDSAKSILVQAADACAYALLRRERPIASKTSLGLDQSFYILEKIMVKAAFGKDPFGIIR